MSPGEMFTPTLRLVRELGRGGMGSVWVAHHIALQIDVVVKTMRPELAADEAARARFHREAAAGAQVKSPHVVQVLDHGTTPNGELFIVLELLEGRNLAELIAERGPLPLAMVDTIVHQAALALEAAHERGIIHRDIKPENVFLCRTRDDSVFVKVLDFGIAKHAVFDQTASETKTGALLGTPFYMSPEQIVDAKRVDQRTDVWSLGALAFEAMTGRPPFQGETVGALAIAITHAPIPRPSELDGRLPKSLDEWFARACERERDRRFATATELATALHRALSGASHDFVVPTTLPLNVHLASTPPVATSQPPRAEAATAPPLVRERPPAAESRVRWGLVGAAAAILVIGVGLFTYSRVAATPGPSSPSSGTASVVASAPATLPPSAPPPTMNVAPPSTTSASASASASVRGAPSASARPKPSFDRNSID